MKVCFIDEEVCWSWGRCKRVWEGVTGIEIPWLFKNIQAHKSWKFVEIPSSIFLQATPIFYLLVLRVTQMLAFLDTNMLVSPMQNCGVGSLSQLKDPTQIVLHRSGI